MPHHRTHAFAIAFLTLCDGRAGAQRQALPPIRPLGRIVAAASDSFKSVNGVRQLRDGRLYVNDPSAQKLVLLDSTLRHATVVIGGQGTAARGYTSRVALLLPFPGDSTLFLDYTAGALLVIDPAGAIARVVSLPTSSTSDLLSARLEIDRLGRLLYDSRVGVKAAVRPSLLSGGEALPMLPDSEPLVRADLSSHRVETVAYLGRAVDYPDTVTTDSGGFVWTTRTLNPMAVRDDWVVTADGSIAIVRARDFHVDWIAPDGTRTSSPKLAHEWLRLSDSDKVAIIDSVHRALVSNPYPETSTKDGVTRSRAHPLNLPLPSQLPDYRPPFVAGAVYPDVEGNVWIAERTASRSGPGAVFDLVNREGVLFDRVQLPGGTSIAGFGAGVVYLSSRAGAGVTLARARIR